MNTEPDDARTAIQAAMEALQRGDRETARLMAGNAAFLAPDNEAPWLILAAASDPEESLGYINRALQINPNSQAAHRAKQWALNKLRAQSPQPPPERPLPPPVEPAVPEPATPPFESFEPELEPVETEEEPFEPRPEMASPSPPPAAASTLVAPSFGADEVKKRPPSRMRIFLISVAALAVVLLIAVFVIIRPQLSGLLFNRSPLNSCQASLIFANHTFQVRTLAPKSNGTYKTPSGNSDVAYWLKGTDTHLGFVLVPTMENLDLATSVKDGDEANLTWPNCAKTTYKLTTMTGEQIFDLAKIDQSSPQITLFIPAGTSTGGYVVHGVLLGGDNQLVGPQESAPVEVDVRLMDIATSQDQSTVTVGLLIQNYGVSTVTLTANDVSLTPAGGLRRIPNQADPNLPAKIEPGGTLEIRLTFARPTSSTAVLKVFTVEYNLEGY